MKKLLCIAAALLAIDQATKHLARHFIGDDLIVFIPGFLNIAPFHNTYLGWLGWFVGVVDEPSPVSLIFLKSAFYVVLLLVAYNYFCFLTQKNRPLLNAFFVLATAGMGGSLIDRTLFGGSWDFIYLEGAIIFDFKDAYLFASIVLSIIFAALYIPQHFKLSKEKRDEINFFAWIKRTYTNFFFSKVL